jgi:hypothetical protein
MHGVNELQILSQAKEKCYPLSRAARCRQRAEAWGRPCWLPIQRPASIDRSRGTARIAFGLA